MTKRMLIDATHAEETRVVVLDGNRLEDFDVETSTKRQLKGNIYLAKVVRVEPSLQAAFVEYGGNRHGFLAFDEIHPDYYQIPVADRQRLLDAQAEEALREAEEDDRAAAQSATDGDQPAGEPVEIIHEPPPETIAESWASAEPPGDAPDTAVAAQPAAIVSETLSAPLDDLPPEAVEPMADAEPAPPPLERVAEAAAEVPAAEPAEAPPIAVAAPEPTEPVHHPVAEPAAAEQIEPAVETQAADTEAADTQTADSEVAETETDDATSTDYDDQPIPESPPPEMVGGEGDNGEDARERRIPSRLLRNYKIQEVIKRRQILLVQVVKEERGTKGAALTTYLSLAGRFCVLMPNSPRGGGISRKITSATDRRRLKDIMAELEIPTGMGLIVRTAGANRPKPEIKRDCEYLLRLWDDIRDHTLKSVAPALIYEEASLIKRAIRDVYSRDVDEIQVDGESGWHAAHDFMRMLMPSHAKKVQLWRDPAGLPLFAKYQVEAQLDSMLAPTAQLRSGGYLVINQAEALVAIDVNSGRSTRERGIEETALRTNLEAADEVARQLRLRDLAGLIVIDFIDMEARKHNAMVEKRLKEALKNDRARIQVGHISHFGLMEMSRQRLRPSLAETSFIMCPHCGGTGHVRSTESAAIYVLRGIEEEGAKRRAAEIVVHLATPIALYIFNHKRDRLSEIEARYAMRVSLTGDDTQLGAQFRIERVRAQIAGEASQVITPDARPAAQSPSLLAAPDSDVEVEEVAVEEIDETEDDETAEAASDAVHAEAGETAEETERRKRRRRRRRRGGRREDGEGPAETPHAAEPAGGEPPADRASAEVPGETPREVPREVPADVDVTAHIEGVPEHAEIDTTAADEQRARRRGRRGGRRRRRDGEDELPLVAEPGAEQPEMPPVYSGPTPANPFGGNFDIFDVLEQVEQAAERPFAIVAPPPEPPPAPPLEPAPEPVAQTPVAEPEPVLFEPVAPQPVVPEPVVVEPVASEPVPIELPEPIPEPVQVAANDSAPEPLVKPIVIGSDEEPVVEKKRGWWRR
jgi:ribonuclease E